MNRKDLEIRTKEFAISVIRFVGKLPKSKLTEVLGYQLLRSGTSIGANYREAGRAESQADFIHKLSIVEKEASETQYWLELFKDTNTSNPKEVDTLLDEASQLLAIFTSAGRTAKRRKK